MIKHIVRFVKWVRHLSEKFVERFSTSRNFRMRVLIGGILLFGLSACTIFTTPLYRGLKGEYFDNAHWLGTPIMTTYDREITLFRTKNETPAILANYSILWTGVISIPVSGDYQFTTISDDGSDLWIDEQKIVDNGGFHGISERTETIHLEKGVHTIGIRYMQGVGDAVFEAYWRPLGQKPRELSDALLFSEKPTAFMRIWTYRTKQVVFSLLVVLWCALGIITGIGVFPYISWKDLSPLHVRLFVFFLISGLTINILLAFFSEYTTLYFSRYFLTSPAHGRSDSWSHMNTALEYFENNPDAPLYSEVFFQQHIKFQYPPTSLLLLKLIKLFAAENFISTANFLSWLGILVTMVLIARLFSASMQRYGTERETPMVERIARIVLAICFSLTFYPVVRSFQAGQVQAWIYVLFVLAVWSWMNERKGLSGVLIGLICIIKPQLGLLAIWGGLRKQWRFVTGILITAAIMGLISLSVFGLANHMDYLDVLSYMSKHGESYYPNHSINGLLHRLLRNGPNVNWDGYYFAPYNQWVYIGTLVSSCIIIAAALFWKLRQHEHAEVIDLLIAALSFTMASPIAWEHHYNILLPMFVIALPATLASQQKQRRGTVLIALSFVLCCNFYLIMNRLADTWLNVLQSYLFFGALVFLIHLYRLRSAQE